MECEKLEEFYPSLAPSLKPTSIPVHPQISAWVLDEPCAAPASRCCRPVSLVPCLWGLRPKKLTNADPGEARKTFQKSNYCMEAGSGYLSQNSNSGPTGEKNISDDGPKTILQTFFPALFQLSPASNFAVVPWEMGFPFPSSCFAMLSGSFRVVMHQSQSTSARYSSMHANMVSLDEDRSKAVFRALDVE